MLTPRIADRIRVALFRRHADRDAFTGRTSLAALGKALADMDRELARHREHLARVDREAGEREAACRRRLTLHVSEHHARVGLRETT